MKIVFKFPDGSVKTSPEFVGPPPAALDYFWDEFIGGGPDQDDELFWNCDLSGADDIIVDWFETPKDCQKMISNMELGLKTSIPPYALWT